MTHLHGSITQGDAAWMSYTAQLKRRTQSSGRTATRKRAEAAAAASVRAEVMGAVARRNATLRDELGGKELLLVALREKSAAAERSIADVQQGTAALRAHSASQVARAREMEAENSRVDSRLAEEQRRVRGLVAGYVEREAAATAALAAQRERADAEEARRVADVTALKGQLAHLVTQLGDMPALREQSKALEQRRGDLRASIVRSKLAPLHDRLVRSRESGGAQRERLAQILAHIEAKLRDSGAGIDREATEHHRLRLDLQNAERELAAAVKEGALVAASTPALTLALASPSALRGETRSEILSRLGAMLREEMRSKTVGEIELRDQATARDDARRRAVSRPSVAAVVSPPAPAPPAVVERTAASVRIDRTGRIVISRGV